MSKYHTAASIPSSRDLEPEAAANPICGQDFHFLRNRVRTEERSFGPARLTRRGNST